jgi:hypothetical protein
MKLFLRWLGWESERASAAEDVERSTVKATAKHGQEAGSEHEDDTAFNWLGTDQSCGNVSDALRGTDDERSFTDTWPRRALAITDDVTRSVEEHAANDSEKATDDDTIPTQTLSLDEDGTDEYEAIDPHSLDEDATDEYEAIDSHSVDEGRTDEYEAIDPQ